MKQRFTERQIRILEYIRSCVEEEGAMPSLKKIAAHFNVTSATMCRHLKTLREKGALVPMPSSKVFPQSELTCSRERCPRLLKVLTRSPEEKSVLAPAGVEDICSISELIAYEMPDDSMFDIGLHCGDILIAVPSLYLQPQAGDLVITDLPGQGLTARTLLSFSGGRIALSAASSDFSDEVAVSSGVTKIYAVVSLIRNF